MRKIELVTHELHVHVHPESLPQNSLSSKLANCFFISELFSTSGSFGSSQSSSELELASELLSSIVFPLFDSSFNSFFNRACLSFRDFFSAFSSSSSDDS